LSNNEEYIKKARFLATQARDDAPHYQHSEIGYNYRMSNVLAGIGLGQMEVLDDHVKIRREHHLFYKEIFKNTKGVTFLEEPNGDYFSNYWLTTIRIDPDKTGFSREDIRLAFMEENIESRPLWKPMHLQPVFEKYPSYENGISEDLFINGLCLPSGSNLNSEQKNRIKAVLLKFI
jgi:dTDP-4-amino-4,6-dideoxygalactose transaminase